MYKQRWLYINFWSIYLIKKPPNFGGLNIV